MSRIFTGAAATVAAIAFASTASANCGSSMYCGTSAHGASQHSTLPALSTWSADTGASYSLNGTSSRYSPSTSYTSSSYTSNYSDVASSAYAAAHYGSGSISESYTMGTADTYSFSGSTSSVANLGYNETLQSTSCPVGVMGTAPGSKVLGCYNVVQPVPKTTYYRVVRPVIYVRYPVPVAVPYTSPCHTVTHYSRYGDFGYGGHHGRRGCR